MRQGKVAAGSGKSGLMKRRLLACGLGLGAAATLAVGVALADSSLLAAGSLYYSTAPPPETYPGPEPVQLALAEPAPTPEAPAAAAPAPVPDPPAQPEPNAAAEPLPPPADEAPRVASTVPSRTNERPLTRPASAPGAERAPEHAAAEDNVIQAKRAIAEAKARFQSVHDYTCTFLKRERIDGRLSQYNIMQMKARTRPQSVYFKFQQPNAGREAIYVAGRNRGRLLAHDVGIGKVVAGTLALDPKGSRAMEDCRHPITDAGIGHLIDEVNERWQAEMRAEDTVVTIHPQARVGDRICTMIESMHPQRSQRFLFYKVKVYIDHEHGLPIRFEAYEWPRRQGDPGELLEEYTYTNLRLNVGLGDRDFDPSNKQYSFGRF